MPDTFKGIVLKKSNQRWLTGLGRTKFKIKMFGYPFVYYMYVENTLKCKNVLKLSLNISANIGPKIILRDLFILFYMR